MGGTRQAACPRCRAHGRGLAVCLNTSSFSILNCRLHATFLSGHSIGAQACCTTWHRDSVGGANLSTHNQQAEQAGGAGSMRQMPSGRPGQHLRHILQEEEDREKGIQANLTFLLFITCNIAYLLCMHVYYMYTCMLMTFF